MKYIKILTYVTILTTVLTLTGCKDSKTADINLGDSNVSQEVTTTPPVTTTTEVVTTPKELTTQEKLQNTSWAGADGNGNILSVAFTDNQVTITSNGYRSDISGYWLIDDEKVTVYSDIALTQQITYYDYILTELGNGSNILYMESLCLSQLDNTSTSFDTITENINTQFATLETITDGSYWVGANSKNADFFVCNYGDIYLYIAEFNSPDTYYYDGRWGITYNNGLYMVDNQSDEYIYFNWRFDESTYKLYLTPTDTQSTEPLEFVKTDSTSFSDAISIVNSHLDGSYVEITTTTEETTTIEVTTISEELSTDDIAETVDISAIQTDIFGNEIQSNENMYYNNPEDVNSNPDDENYNDYTEYFDNYTKAPENLYPQYYYTTQAPYDYNYSYDSSYDYNSYDYNSYGY